MIQSGGNVKVNALGDVESEAEGELNISQDAAGGLAVSLSFDDSKVENRVDGTITATGSVVGSTFDASSLSSPTATLFMPNHGYKTGDEVVYLASRSGGAASPLDSLLSGDRYHVVAIDDSHLQLVREPAIDLSLDAFGPYDPMAASHPQQSLHSFRNVTFNSASAVDLTTNRITVNQSQLANLNEIVDGMSITYYHASDDPDVSPVAIGGLDGGSTYIVKNVSVVNGSSISFQLATTLSPNQIIDLTSAGVGGAHLLRFAAPAQSFTPQVAVDPQTDELTITNHGWQTGDEVVYHVDPSVINQTSVTKTALFSNALTITINPASVDDLGQVTVDPATDTLRNIDLSGLAQGAKVRYVADASGTAIGGLTSTQFYYIIQNDDGTVQLASSAANAASRTAINLTSTGTGTAHQFLLQPSDSIDQSILIPGHGLFTGQTVHYTPGRAAGSATAVGANSFGLASSDTYYIIRIDDNKIALADSLADAVAGQARTLNATYSNNDYQGLTSTTAALTFNATQTQDLVDLTNNKIRLANHGYQTGAKVKYFSGGNTAIGGLTDGAEYFVVVSSSSEIQLSTTDPVSATATIVDLTTTAAMRMATICFRSSPVMPICSPIRCSCHRTI